MKGALPFVGMLMIQFSQVGLMFISKEAIADGMSYYSFVFYSNALPSLILLPTSLVIYRSSIRSLLSFMVLSGFTLLGLLNFFAQISAYAGISYSSAALSSSMLNLMPGFTFILAVLFRMERVHWKSKITQAKSIGTLVSIVGAIIVTLYKGPTVIAAPLHSIDPRQLLVQPVNWIIGGVLMAISCVFGSINLVAQGLILKKYPIVVILIGTCCSVVAVLSAFASLILEENLSSYSLLPKIRLLSVLYSGGFTYTFNCVVSAWCVKRKGPLFVAMFQPVGTIVANAVSVIFVGDGFSLGSLVGSLVIVIGLYSVLWGKAEEKKLVAANAAIEEQIAPLLQ